MKKMTAIFLLTAILITLSSCSDNEAKVNKNTADVSESSGEAIRDISDSTDNPLAG